jgi:hypothetical protein
MSAALMEPFSSSAGSTSSSGASSAHGSTAPAGTIPITRYSGRAQYLHLPRPEAAAPARSAAGTRRTATSRISLWQDANVRPLALDGLCDPYGDGAGSGEITVEARKDLA